MHRLWFSLHRQSTILLRQGLVLSEVERVVSFAGPTLGIVASAIGTEQLVPLMAVRRLLLRLRCVSLR